MTATFPREEFSLTFTGEAIQGHSMDIVSLAKPWRRFRRLPTVLTKFLTIESHL